MNNLHHPQCQAFEEIIAKQQEEIEELREALKLIHLNSRSNYISPDQKEKVKAIRTKFNLDNEKESV